MRKISCTLALVALLLGACKEKETVHETVTEKTITENVADDPADTVIIKETDQAPEGTAVKIDGDGITVDTRDGKKNVDVDVDVKK